MQRSNFGRRFRGEELSDITIIPTKRFQKVNSVCFSVVLVWRFRQGLCDDLPDIDLRGFHYLSLSKKRKNSFTNSAAISVLNFPAKFATKMNSSVMYTTYM